MKLDNTEKNLKITKIINNLFAILLDR